MATPSAPSVPAAPLPRHHSAPPSSNIPPSQPRPPAPVMAQHPTHVSEIAYEFLLGEVLQYVEAICTRDAPPAPKARDSGEAGGISEENIGVTGGSASREERAILAAERSAAKIERIGFGVGYRLCERLAQNRPLIVPSATPSSASPGGGSAGGISSDPQAQLEAVKFLCKEFWTEVFRKQIDKLQTNHRGVFVLKDHELRWLRRLPPDDEMARVAAIKMLAFPCGLIRGALANLGIGAVVSCDFLADGKTMAACSFNIKIK